MKDKNILVRDIGRSALLREGVAQFWNTYLPAKWLAILAMGLGGRAGGCLRRESCFTGVSSWSPEKAADFLGGSSKTGLDEGSCDRWTPDSLDVGLSSDARGHNHIIDATMLQAKP